MNTKNELTASNSKLSNKQVNYDDNRKEFSFEITGTNIKPNKSECLGLSSTITDKWNKDFESPFQNLSKALGGALSDTSKMSALSDFPTAVTGKWNKAFESSFLNLSKSLGEALYDTSKMSTLSGFSTAVTGKWNKDFESSFQNLSKVLGEALYDKSKLSTLSGFPTAVTGKWNKAFETSFQNLSKSLGEALYDTSKMSTLSGFSAAVTGKWNKDFEASFQNFSKALGEALYDTSDMNNSHDLIASLAASFSQKSIDNIPIEKVMRDIVEDITILDKDFALNEGIESPQNIERRNTLLGQIFLIYFAMILSFYQPIILPLPEDASLVEIRTSVTENYKRISEVLNTIKNEAEIKYEKTDAYLDENVLASFFYKNILGNLVVNFINAFFQKMKKQSTKDCLTFDNVKKAATLIDKSINEMPVDDVNKQIIREVLQKNLLMTKRDKIKVRRKRNGDIFALLNKNQLIILLEKDRKWAYVNFYKNNKLEQGWVLSKYLKKSLG